MTSEMPASAGDNYNIFPDMAVLQKLVEKNDGELEILFGDKTEKISVKKDRFLGKGEISLVFKCPDDSMSVYKIYPLAISDKKNPDRFKRIAEDEASLGIKLTHHNIAKYVSIGSIKIANKEFTCIKKENIPTSLEDYFAEHNFDFNKKMEIILDMVEGIASAAKHIHEQTERIITDLTPKNIGVNLEKDSVWKIREVGQMSNPGTEFELGYDDRYSAPEVRPETYRTPGDSGNHLKERNNGATLGTITYSLSLIIWEILTDEKIDPIAGTFGSNPINNKENKIPESIYAILESGTRENKDMVINDPELLAKKLKAAYQNYLEQTST